MKGNEKCSLIKFEYLYGKYDLSDVDLLLVYFYIFTFVKLAMPPDGHCSYQ